MKLEKSKSGHYILISDNKYIHSKYNPINESEKFIDNYKHLFNEENIVVYGLGLGYHIDRLIEKVPKSSIIYVFEYNKEMVKLCRTINRNLFNDRRIRIITSEDEKFYITFSKMIKQSKDIIIHRASLETIKASNNTLYTSLEQYMIKRKAVDMYKDIMNDNLIKNKCVKSLTINEFITSFGGRHKKMIVASAGPSLDDEVHNIKSYRDEYFIICVGSALKTLMDNGIIPNGIVIIDPSELVYNQIKGYENIEVPLCFLATASSLAVEKYSGPKYIFYNSGCDEKNLIKTGNTVAVSALDLAVKCGADEVIMVGQDLACIGEQSHTSKFEDIYGNEDFGGKLKNNIETKKYDKGIIKTNKSFMLFKKQIEELIEEYKTVNFYNCSKGAWIKGAEHIEFIEYLRRKRDEDDRK